MKPQEVSAVLAPPSERSEADQRLIRDTCSPCDYFQQANEDCRLVEMQSSWFLKIFESKRCQPREFMEAFLTKRLSRRLGSVDRARVEAEDIASQVVLSLHENPPESAFLSNDLVGARRFLAARSVQVEIAFRRGTEGRMRCGNCKHHRNRPGEPRVCVYPDSNHPWAGREVKASLDPRKFEPACTTYSARKRVESGGGDSDYLDLIESSTDLPDAGVVLESRNRVLMEALRAVQKVDAKIAFVLTGSFLRSQSNEDLAQELGCSTKSVIRYKSSGLELLKREFTRRGLSDFGELA